MRHGGGIARAATAAASAAAEAAAEPATHAFCSPRASGYFAAMPFRSPVTEWQMEQSDVNSASPAFGVAHEDVQFTPVGIASRRTALAAHRGVNAVDVFRDGD